MPNNYIIYHMVNTSQICPDGYAAAWVVDRWLRQQNITSIKMVGRSHQYENNKLYFGDNPKNIYIVDYHYPAKTLKRWLKQGHKVTMIDHHLAAKDLLDAELDNPNLTLVVNFEQSAAITCWQHYFPDEPVPEFLKYISDRDLMLNRLEQTILVHAAYGLTGRSFELYEKLAAMSKEELLDYMCPLGAKINGPFQQSIGRVVKRHKLGQVAGINNIPYVMLRNNERPLISDIAKELYHMYPKAPFVALKSSNNVWSLRNSPNGEAPNINELVELWRPKGHHHAVIIKTDDPSFFNRNYASTRASITKSASN
jgi:hypothetical protein